MLVLVPLATAAILMVLTIRVIQMERKARTYHNLRKSRMAFFPQV